MNKNAVRLTKLFYRKSLLVGYCWQQLSTEILDQDAKALVLLSTLRVQLLQEKVIETVS